MSKFIRLYSFPILITTLFLILSFWLHWKSCGSPLTAPEDYWNSLIELHQYYYPFNIRPLTTDLTVYMTYFFDLPVRESFFIIQFALAFLLGLFFYKYLRVFKFNHKWSCAGVFLLMSAYPILGAHFQPVYTWDDFWMYLFLIISFTKLVEKRFLVSAIFFTAACFAREHAVIFYPVLAFGAFSLRFRVKRSRFLFFLIPVIVYGIYYLIVRQPYEWHVGFNFENNTRSSDTLMSVILAFGFVWAGWLVGIVQSNRKPKSRIDRFLIWSSVFTLIADLLVVLFLGRARETRLLFPPFLFVIPVAMITFHSAIEYLRENFRARDIVMGIIIAVLMCAGWVILIMTIKPYFEFRQCANYAYIWAGIAAGIMTILFILYGFSNQLQKMFDNYLLERANSAVKSDKDRSSSTAV